MKVLIVGSNARTGSARYAQRYMTFARLIQEAHLHAGHDVEIRNWTPSLLIEESWDRVYVGLATPAWIGSDRIYGSLAVIADMWGSKPKTQDPRLRLFIDDPDLRVLVNGISSMTAQPEKLFTPINVKRQNYHYVTGDQRMRDRVSRALVDLNGWDTQWPITYIPAHGWADMRELTKPLRPMQKISVRGVDPSALVPMDDLLVAADDATVPSALVPRGQFWVAEGPARDPWTTTVHVSSAVMSARTTNDATRIALYRDALGVLEPQLSPSGSGWWSSRVQYAAAAETYYASDWRKLHGYMPRSLPYTRVLPAAFEELPETDQQSLVMEQRESLAASVGSIADVQEALHVFE
jgi:hypothetical protein